MTVSISQYDFSSLGILPTDWHCIGQVTDFITQADKLNTLIKAAKIEDVEPIWSSLFAKVRITRMRAERKGNTA
jgi:hypothetical protein